MCETHIVPLSDQALAVLRERRTLTGNRSHLLPNVAKSTTPMSENTIGLLWLEHSAPFDVHERLDPTQLMPLLGLADSRLPVDAGTATA